MHLPEGTDSNSCLLVDKVIQKGVAYISSLQYLSNSFLNEFVNLACTMYDGSLFQSLTILIEKVLMRGSLLLLLLLLLSVIYFPNIKV